jgi:hypothetical protein
VPLYQLCMYIIIVSANLKLILPSNYEIANIMYWVKYHRLDIIVVSLIEKIERPMGIIHVHSILVVGISYFHRIFNSIPYNLQS